MPFSCSAKKKQSVSSKITNTAMGMGKGVLAGACLAPAALMSIFAVILKRDRDRYHAGHIHGLLQRPTALQEFFWGDLFLFSTVVGVAAWLGISYKLAHSGVNSFMEAARPVEDDVKEDAANEDDDEEGSKE